MEQQDFIYIQVVLPSDITMVIRHTVVTSSFGRTSFSATSRSLSGAPYLLTTSYGYSFVSHVSKSFDLALWIRNISVLVNSNSTNTGIMLVQHH